MNNRIFIVVLLLLVSQLSWSADQKEKKNDDKSAQPFPLEGVVYALPRTVFSVEVELVKEVFFPGPYALYAEKYLGVQGARTANAENWKIVGLKVNCTGEADPLAVFKTTGTSATMVSLTSDGTLAGINLAEVPSIVLPEGNDLISYSEVPDIIFPDQSSFDQYDVSVNSETGTERITFKTVEEKAREAADFLYRLRQKRAYTILSPSDVVPEDGKGYEVFVQQVEKTEKEYVSLFLGKTFKSKHSFTIAYTPGADNVKNEVLFRFSEEKGILPKSDISGRPVTIELTKDARQASSVEKVYQASVPNAAPNGIFYRIPVNASLSVSDGFTLLFTGRYPVAQYGYIAPLSDMLINENTSVTFDRVTGAIKNYKKLK